MSSSVNQSRDRTCHADFVIKRATIANNANNNSNYPRAIFHSPKFLIVSRLESFICSDNLIFVSVLPAPNECDAPL